VTNNLTLAPAPGPSVRKLGPEPSESAFTPRRSTSVRKVGMGLASLGVLGTARPRPDTAAGPAFTPWSG
jgi:hypothetical protein